MRLVSFIWEILQQNSPPFWPKDEESDFSREKHGERKVGDGMELMSLFVDL